MTKQIYDLVVTEWIGRAGCAQIYAANRDKIREHFAPAFIRVLEERIPEREQDTRTPDEKREAIELVLGASGAAAPSFREVGEGGIWSALWNLAEALQCGLRAEIDRIPLKQETIEVCEFCGAHPYYLAGGPEVLCIACEHGKMLCDRLHEQGIAACCIGYTTQDHDRILKHGSSIRYLDKPRNAVM